jgi:hypothetical protein
MGKLRKGKKFWTAHNVDLCREPTIVSKTSDGKDNAIRCMVINSVVRLESARARIVDEQTWYQVRYVDDGIDEIGWIMSRGVSNSPYAVGGGDTTIYSFIFDRKKYKITETNLATAIQLKYIFSDSVQGTIEIELASADSSNSGYTTAKNIKAMKNAAVGSITLQT